MPKSLAACCRKAGRIDLLRKLQCADNKTIMKNETARVLNGADFKRAVGVQRDIFNIMLEGWKNTDLCWSGDAHHKMCIMVYLG